MPVPSVSLSSRYAHPLSFTTFSPAERKCSGRERGESGEMGREPKTAVHFAVRLFVPAASIAPVVVRSVPTVPSVPLGTDERSEEVTDSGTRTVPTGWLTR